MRRRRWVAICAGWLLAGGMPAASAQTAAGRPVVDVRIQCGEVFDPLRPGEDHFVFRWANALHVRTRLHVVQRELLLGVGDTYDPALAAESERNLRGLGIFQDVSIRTEDTPEGIVLWVRTSDRWTTELRTELRSQGGISQVGLGVTDGNLFGRGLDIGGSITSSTDVDSRSLSWRDPRLAGTRWATSGAYRHDELSRAWRFGLEHPFYADRARWTAAFEVTDSNGDQRRFESGEESERLEVDETLADGFAAWHTRGSGLERWGMFATRRNLRGAGESDIATLGFLWSRMQREFRAVREVDQFGAIEDVAQGWTLQLGAGADLQMLGAGADRPFARADVAAARFLGTGSLVGARVRQHAYFSHGDVANAQLGFETFGYARAGTHQTFAWRAGVAAVVHEPRNLRFNLGGDDRLRGYEARHLSGERIAYLNAEDRLFSDFRLFFIRMGAVVFADAAVAWDTGEALATDHARLGAGIGLRLGTNRTGSSISGIDLAFGTNSFQISFANGNFFRAARGLSFLDPRPFR